MLILTMTLWGIMRPGGMTSSPSTSTGVERDLASSGTGSAASALIGSVGRS